MCRRNYATMSHDEFSKNHPRGLKDVEGTGKKARMYEIEDKGDDYKALKLYLQKKNAKFTAFFQHPKKNNMALDAVWHEARPLGINCLFLPTITASHHKLLSNPRRSRSSKWLQNCSSTNALFKTCKCFSTFHSLNRSEFQSICK